MTSDPREFLAQAGRLVGRPAEVDDIMSGRLEADTIAPLLAGMIDGAIRNMFGPVVGIDAYITFEPEKRPLVAEVVLLDGSVLRVTVEAVSRG